MRVWSRAAPRFAPLSQCSLKHYQANRVTFSYVGGTQMASFPIERDPFAQSVKVREILGSSVAIGISFETSRWLLSTAVPNIPSPLAAPQWYIANRITIEIYLCPASRIAKSKFWYHTPFQLLTRQILQLIQLLSSQSQRLFIVHPRVMLFSPSYSCTVSTPAPMPPSGYSYNCARQPFPSHLTTSADCTPTKPSTAAPNP